jgi:hypothetical protein
MHQDRIYCLDEEGRFSKASEIEAPNDEAALAEASALNHPGPCEVWRGNRLVGTVGPMSLARS